MTIHVHSLLSPSSRPVSGFSGLTTIEHSDQKMRRDSQPEISAMIFVIIAGDDEGKDDCQHRNDDRQDQSPGMTINLSSIQ